MSFITFLKEYTNHGKIVLQQVLDNLDDGHIDYDNDRIEINVGSIIKKSKYSNLIIIIHANKPKHDMKFGIKKATQEYAIVISITENMPKRKEIDSFISNTDTVYDGILANMNEYFNKKQFSENKKTSYEQTNELNSDEQFEMLYDKLTRITNEKLKEYKDVKLELENELHATNNPSRKHTIKLAIDKLKKDIIGTSLGDFSKILYSVIDNESIKSLESKYKEKMKSRISSLYDTKISNLD